MNVDKHTFRMMFFNLLYLGILRWFDKGFWKYLLLIGDSPCYSHSQFDHYGFPGWRKLWCRLHYHKGHGVVWFNPGGLEPDMSCRNCGDDLG